MLTAWDTLHARPLVLPDYDSRDQLEDVREQARRGELLCPTCRQLLWLRAGDIRTPHFGHRALNDCPAAAVSEAVLAARRQLYRFFRLRIEAGKLAAEVELEPQVPAFATVGTLDMLLRRAQKPAVAIWIVERSLKPDTRAGLISSAARERWLFRPVFLQARLKPAPDSNSDFLLDTTQREFQLRSPYGVNARHDRHGGGALHFIDADHDRWTTLRGLSLVHEPQLFAPVAVRTSPMGELLWTEAYSEWVHPGEAEALKAFRDAQAEELRRQRKAQLESPRGKPPVISPAEQIVQAVTVAALTARHSPEPEATPEPEPPRTEVEPALPGWIVAGLVCLGCGQRTTDWQNASPGQDACVCRSCFSKGVRLSR